MLLNFSPRQGRLFLPLNPNRKLSSFHAAELQHSPVLIFSASEPQQEAISSFHAAQLQHPPGPTFSTSQPPREAVSSFHATQLQHTPVSTFHQHLSNSDSAVGTDQGYRSTDNLQPNPQLTRQHCQASWTSS